MHSILALTLMHDRSLYSLTSPLTTKEAFHWYRSASLFKAKLSSQVLPSERDPLWAAAMGLGIVSFFYVEGDKPTDVWPLSPASSMDLNWLKMIDGKKEVWRVAGPPTENSIFEKPYPENIKFLLPPPSDSGFKSLSPEFIKMYELNTLPADDSNPYRAAATSLTQTLPSNDLLPVIMGFLTFVGNISPDYKQLLEQKDPRALLLLAYWYAKVCKFEVWWLSRRALLEGQAICIYLERYHQYCTEITHLLHFPSTVFRLFNGR
jgi:hypothetical protein